jgi:hypothetical protein
MNDRYIALIREGSRHAGLSEADKNVLKWALDTLIRTQLKLTEAKLDLIARSLCFHPSEDIPTDLVQALGERYAGGAYGVRAAISRYTVEA